MPIRRTFRKDSFKTWSADMSYVLGFLYADGNVVQTKRGTHFVSGYSCDKELIVAMKRVINSNHKISECLRKTRIMYKIQIGSKELFEDLGRIGLIPDKTKRMRLPDIPYPFVSDFIRGYFDGDGNVWIGNTHKERKNSSQTILAAFTSCSVGFLEDLLDLLSKRGINGGCIYKARSGTYGRLTLSTLDALKLYKIMYNDPCSLFLSRKRAVFERFMHMRL